MGKKIKEGKLLKILVTLAIILIMIGGIDLFIASYLSIVSYGFSKYPAPKYLLLFLIGGVVIIYFSILLARLANKYIFKVKNRKTNGEIAFLKLLTEKNNTDVNS